MNEPGWFMDQLTPGYAPLAGGRSWRQKTGMEGLPFMDQGGAMGLGAQTLFAPYLMGMMGSQGMMPFGVGHDQNVYDIMRNYESARSRQALLQAAAQQDRQSYMEAMRGGAAMLGVPWGIQQRRAAGAVADFGVMATPLLAEIAPEMLDQLAGSRGSATVMAHRMMMGNRYRIDPVTGRMGFSGASNTAMQGQLFQDLFTNGELSDLRGMTAGQFGGLYDELSRRGMISGPSQPPRLAVRSEVMRMHQTDPLGLAEAARNQGVSLPSNLAELRPEDLDKLRLDPAVGDRLRSLDTNRVKQSLKQYVDAVSAMRDIFGDMGRPDAPMGQLIAGLEALTQGGVGRIDPGRLNMMVRTTQELSRATGVSMDSALMVQQHAANRAVALGIDPLHAVAATQGSLAWGGAYRAMGGNSVAAWGRNDADAMLQLDTNLRVSAAASQSANRLGVLMRMRQAAGGFEAGSTAEAMSRAVMAGETEFIDPTTGAARSLRMSGTEFANVMQGARSASGESLGLSSGQIAGLLSQRYTNEEYIERYDIGGIVRQMQPGEMRDWRAKRYQESLSQALQGAGMDAAAANAAAAHAAHSIAKGVSGMNAEQYAANDTRLNMMGGFIRDSLKGTAAESFLSEQGMGEMFFRGAAERMYGYEEKMLQYGEMRGIRSSQNFQAAMSESTLLEGARVRAQAQFEAQIASNMSPLGRGTPLQRLMQYMKDADPTTANFEAMLGRAFGAVDTNELAKALQSPLSDIRAKEEELRKVQAQIADTTDNEAKARLMEQKSTLMEQHAESVRKAVSVAENIGVYSDNQVLTSTDVLSAQRMHSRRRGGSRTLAALQGAWTGTIPEGAAEISEAPTEEEVQALVAKGMSPEEARNVATAKRQARRLGLSEASLGDGSLKAIDYAIQEKMKSRFTVTDEQVRIVQSETGLGFDEAKAEALRRRNERNRGDWDAFWKTESGALQREATEADMASKADFSVKALLSDKTMQRLGVEGMRRYDAIRGGQQRLQTLAMYHSGGDMAKLLAGDYSSIDVSTKEGQAKWHQVQQEVAKIEREQEAAMAWMQNAVTGTAPVSQDFAENAKYLHGAGATAAQLKETEEGLRLVHKMSAEDKAKLASMSDADLDLLAQRMGVSPDAVRAAKKASTLATEQLGRRRAGELENAGQLLPKMLKAYGLSDDPAMVQKLASRAGNKDGTLGVMRRLLDDSVYLKEIAGKRRADLEKAAAAATSPEEKARLLARASEFAASDDDPMAGVTAMKREYDAIAASDPSQRETKLKQFKKNYGIGSDLEMRNFEDAMALQQYTGMLEAGDARTGSREFRTRMFERGLDALNRSGGEMADRSPHGEGELSNVIHVKGDLTIHGQVGSVEATGSRTSATQR